jgi:hypothetical protein
LGKVLPLLTEYCAKKFNHQKKFPAKRGLLNFLAKSKADVSSLPFDFEGEP